eukprot:4108826-Pyramimonas_sp.AAC.3
MQCLVRQCVDPSSIRVMVQIVYVCAPEQGDPQLTTACLMGTLQALFSCCGRAYPGMAVYPSSMPVYKRNRSVHHKIPPSGVADYLQTT